MRSKTSFLLAFFIISGLVIYAASRTPESSPAPRELKRHLFSRTPLYQQEGSDYIQTGLVVAEATYRVIATTSNIQNYDWLRIVDPAKGIDGWIHEHLTSAVPEMVIPASGQLPIGHERVDRYEALPHDYRPKDLVLLDWEFCKIRQIELREEAAEAFKTLHRAAKKDGILIYGFSGYRSYDYQRNLYLNRIKIGEMHRQEFVARPGHTEHQLGTVLDVVGPETRHAAQNSFDSTPEARWLATNCYHHGFVLSYGKDNLTPTGYGFESWHIRYLGKEAIPAWVRTHLDPRHPVAREFSSN